MSTPSHQPVLVLKREGGGEGGSEEEKEKKPGGCQWGSAIAHSLPAVGGNMYIRDLFLGEFVLRLIRIDRDGVVGSTWFRGGVSWFAAALLLIQLPVALPHLR